MLQEYLRAKEEKERKALESSRVHTEQTTNRSGAGDTIRGKSRIRDKSEKKTEEKPLLNRGKTLTTLKTVSKGDDNGIKKNKSFVNLGEDSSKININDY